ncbi:MAG: DUF4178 domain-containing protein [Deltaproteobacteria bacterium]|nr:DUF4178 domain-containing protein [Deltaproteobacteria bacterium]
MDATNAMKGKGNGSGKGLKARDVLSYLGRDYIVAGVVVYKLNGKVHPLACAVDGDVTLWVEPLMDDLDDRMLVLTEVRDLDIGTPPPESISYRKSVFVPRWSGRATVEIAGQVPDQTAGPREVWRYRGAGDVFLQIEARATGTVVLFGESVHKGMIDVLPGT